MHDLPTGHAGPVRQSSNWPCPLQVLVQSTLSTMVIPKPVGNVFAQHVCPGEQSLDAPHWKSEPEQVDMHSVLGDVACDGYVRQHESPPPQSPSPSQA